MPRQDPSDAVGGVDNFFAAARELRAARHGEPAVLADGDDRAGKPSVPAWAGVNDGEWAGRDEHVAAAIRNRGGWQLACAEPDDRA